MTTTKTKALNRQANGGMPSSTSNIREIRVSTILKLLSPKLVNTIPERSAYC